ncbi:MAG: hypothetical protein FJ296_02185 [Planctomycetes bacterium]|nr:hypothetical protein [Planctomycetota bacterium]
MRKSLIVVPVLSSALLLGAAALDGVPSAPTWWKTPHQPKAGPSDGVVPGILDNTWWKLKVGARGYTVDVGTGAAAPGVFSTTAYMYLAAAAAPLGDGGGGGGGTPAYDYEMVTETAPNVWSSAYGIFSVDRLDANLNHALTVNTFMGFITESGNVAANHTGRLTIKVDGEGALVSAKLKTLAGEVTESTLDPSGMGNRFWGSLKIAGKTIDPEDLPFMMTPPPPR